MTGASGGGYNTWMMAALDDRISVAVPVVGTCEFHSQMAARRPRDWDPNDHCHYIPGLMTFANNHELAAMVAPRPLLIVSATEDASFPIAGVREVAGYTKGLYASYGAAEKTAFSEDSSAGHGFQQKKREAAYGWFLRWLAGEAGSAARAEPPTITLPYDAPELRCFPPGENHPAGPAMVAVAQKLAQSVRPRKPAATLRDLETVFGPQPAAPEFRPSLERTRIQRLSIPAEPGLNVPGFLLRPDGDERGVLIAMDDSGKEALASEPLVANALQKGWAVCGLDPRGIGELATTKPNWIFAASLLLGENFVWRQSFDVVQAARYLAASGAYRRFAIYGRGHNAALAAIYAAAQLPGLRQAPLEWFVLRDGFLSYRQFLERPESLPLSYALQTGRAKPALDREIPPAYFPFDALRAFDLPQLIAAAGAHGMVVNPINGDWKPMAEPDARKLLPARIQIVCAADPQDAVTRFVQGR
jgi:hypothetical protein